MIDKNILGRTGEKAYGINYAQLSTEQQQWLDDYVRNLGLPPGPPTQQGLYASPAATGKPYPSPPKQNANQNQETPEGWPRQPVFNPPGNVPGPPIQFGDPIKPADVTAGDGFVGNGLFEKDIFYYHNDHLGSTSYISTMNGQLSQHVEYIAFGEVLFEEHSSSFSMPYLFNGKELDRETNLTYYGARYLDMKTSLWLNVDPLAEEFPNASSYVYCLNNPIKLIDPDGKAPNSPIYDSQSGKYLGNDSQGFLKGEILFMDKAKYQELSKSSKNGIIDHTNAVKNSTAISNLASTENNLRLFNTASDHIVKTLYKFFYHIDPTKELALGRIQTASKELGIGTERATPVDDEFGNHINIGGNKEKVTNNFDQRVKLNTAANIFSNFEHEFRGHGNKVDLNINLLKSDPAYNFEEHKAIYNMQINSPNFRFTTGPYRQHVINSKNSYSNNE
ncbi:RHS repeat domain-containing protein [Flavobacterium columnare]|uniref:RHS repeat domain-containing protein n=1 Tax=Flavobacterium columnare TaxID=996 RepID=UPI003C2F0611